MPIAERSHSDSVADVVTGHGQKSWTTSHKAGKVEEGASRCNFVDEIQIGLDKI